MNIDNVLNRPGNVTSGYEAVSQRLNESEKERDVFGQALDAAMELFNETNKLQKESDIAQLNFITGRDDNILSVTLAQEKALTSLNFTVQVTNKIVEAYKEIMRIQI